MTSVLGPDGKLASLRVDSGGRLLTTGGFVYQGTSASLPAANSVPQYSRAQLTDLNLSEWYTDGTNWRPVGRQTLVSWVDHLGTAVTFTDTGNVNRLFSAQQWFIRGLLLAPRTQLQVRSRWRKTGVANTASASVTIRSTQFTSPTDTGGSFGMSGGTLTAAQIGLANNGYIIVTNNDRALLHLSWFGDTATTPSASMPETAIQPSMGLYFCPNASVNTGADVVSMLTFSLEAY